MLQSYPVALPDVQPRPEARPNLQADPGGGRESSRTVVATGELQTMNHFFNDRRRYG